MNERIQELAEQAGYTEGYYESDDGPFIEPEFNKEKFAELIVRECAGLIDNKQMITAPETYDEVFWSRYDTKEQCAKQIREHFGVEE